MIDDPKLKETYDDALAGLGRAADMMERNEDPVTAWLLRGIVEGVRVYFAGEEGAALPPDSEELEDLFREGFNGVEMACERAVGGGCGP